MSYSSTQFATSRQMGIYEPFRQIGMWKETFRGDHTSNTAASTNLEDDSGIENKVKPKNESFVPFFFNVRITLFVLTDELQLIF